MQAVDKHGQGLVVQVCCDRTNGAAEAPGYVRAVDIQRQGLVAQVCCDRTNGVAEAPGCVRAVDILRQGLVARVGYDRTNGVAEAPGCVRRTVLGPVGSSASFVSGSPSPGGLQSTLTHRREEYQRQRR